MQRRSRGILGALILLGLSAAAWVAFRPGADREAWRVGDPEPVAPRAAPSSQDSQDGEPISGRIRVRCLDVDDRPVSGVSVAIACVAPEIERAPRARKQPPSLETQVAASLQAIDKPDVGARAPERTDFSDARGDVVFSVTRSGRYEVWGLADGDRWATQKTVWVDRSALDVGVWIRVGTGRPFRGQVLDVDGHGMAAVASGSWEVVPGETALLAPMRTPSARGEISWPAVPDGKGTVNLVVPGVRRCTLSVTTPVEGVAPLQLARGRSVQVRVRDGEGKAVSSANVLVNADTAAVRGRTSAEGLCRLDGLPLKPLTSVVVLADGFLAASEKAEDGTLSSTGSDKDPLEAIEIVLTRGGTIVGRVTSEDGQQVQDATVLALPMLGAAQTSARGSRVDETGAFRIGPVPLGGYALIVRSRTHVQEALVVAARFAQLVPHSHAGAPFVLVGGEGDALAPSLVLRRGRVVTGRVLGADGEPVSGAWIFTAKPNFADAAQAWGASFDVDMLDSARSEEDGSFRLENVPAGAAVISAVAPGRVPSSEEEAEVSSEEEGREITLRLPVGGILEGRVTEADGRPVRGRSLWWVSENYGLADSPRVRTDVDGAFRLTGVPLGLGAVELLEGIGEKTRLEIRPALGVGERREGLLLVRAPRGVVEGLVVGSNGAALPGQTVFVQGPSDRVPRRRSTGEDGKFRFEAVVGSRLQFRTARQAPTGEGGPTSAVDVVVPASGIRLQATEQRWKTVQVRIRSKDGKPIPWCRLGTSQDPTRPPSDRPWFPSRPVVDGRCTCRVVEGEPLALRVGEPRDARGNRMNLMEHTWSYAEAPAETVLTLEAGRELRGRLLDESERGIPNATVRTEEAVSLSDASGAFCLRGLSGAPVLLDVQPATHAFAEIWHRMAVPGADELVLHLSPSGVVHGRVVDEARRPVMGALVEANWDHESAVRSGPDGRFTCRDSDGIGMTNLRVGSGASSDGRRWRVDTYRLKSLASPLELTLVPESLVAGRVLEADGTPAGGVKVEAPGSATRSSESKVDEYGRFELHGLGSETYQVTVRRESTGGLLVASELVTAPNVVLQIQLPRRHTIRGRVEGRDLASPHVSAYTDPAFHGECVSRVQVGPDGTWVLDVPEDRAYALLARSYRGLLATGKEVRPGQEVVLKLEEGKTISGSVIDLAGRPVADVYVQLLQAGLLQWGSTSTTRDGVFEFKGLLPGSYRLRFRVDTYVETLSTPVEAGTQDVTWVFREGAR